MIPVLEQSLAHQDRCPICKANWRQLEFMLNEPLDSGNRQVALTFIRNCDVCQVRFRKQTEGEL